MVKKCADKKVVESEPSKRRPGSKRCRQSRNKLKLLVLKMAVGSNHKAFAIIFPLSYPI